MNTSHFAAPRVLAPLHVLWRWLSQTSIPQIPTSNTGCNLNPSFTVSSPLTTRSRQHQSKSLLPTRAIGRPLRIIRVLEENHVPANVGRMVISGRMADVCAELDRLADRESAIH